MVSATLSTRLDLRALATARPIRHDCEMVCSTAHRLHSAPVTGGSANPTPEPI
ncbi:hypothetical protein PC116_g32361 [Phytophthora cactorum]|nr:hypothetical protein PC116_g32361 [Phytophthora cactorum]